MKGWTVTVWVDVPDDWNAERVREEIDALLAKDTYEADESPLVLNTVHTPRPDRIAEVEAAHAAAVEKLRAGLIGGGTLDDSIAERHDT